MIEIVTELPDFKLYFVKAKEDENALIEYISLSRGEKDILVFIRKFKMFSDINDQIVSDSLMTVYRGAYDCNDEKAWKAYEKTLHKARKEVINKDSIDGYEVLLLNKNQKVWISHYDWEYLSLRRWKR